MSIISPDFIIRERQKEIISEVSDIEDRIRTLQLEIEGLISKRDMRIAEHDILDRIDGRNELLNSASGKMKAKIPFDDCIKMIFDHYGRPMKPAEIIEELKKYNHVWSTKTAAYQHLYKCDIIEKVTWGYYQLRRNF